jgi:hypothetical protein
MCFGDFDDHIRFRVDTSTLHEMATVVYPDDKRMRISYCFKENTFPVHTPISVQTGTPASGRNFLSLCHKEQVN